MMTLLEDLVVRLPHQNLMEASIADIKATGKNMIRSGKSREQMSLLQASITTFFDVALHLKVAEHHPIRHKKPAWSGPRTTTLTVGLNPDQFQRVQSTLSLPKAEIEAEPSVVVAATMVQWYPFDCVVCAHPLEQPGVKGLAEKVRLVDSPSRRAALLVLAPDGDLEEVARSVGHSCTAVIPESEIARLKTELVRHHEIAERTDLKVPMLVNRTDGTTSRRTIWQTVNISTSGLFARTTTKVELGSVIDCELTLPEATSSIRFTLEVTRISSPEHEKLTGVAGRFTKLAPGDHCSIESFIRRQG